MAVSNAGYEFTSWSNGSTEPIITITVNQNITLTAYFRLIDDDDDGVNNSLDQCDNTPSGATVNAQGCSTSQIDTDGDGVFDDVDQDNNTRGCRC